MTARIDDPLRQWKLSPMDLESWPRWYEYSRARDRMLEATDTKHAPWYILRSDDKRRARLNCLAHILDLIPYKTRSARQGDAAQALDEAPLRRPGQPEGQNVRFGEVLNRRIPVPGSSEIDRGLQIGARPRGRSDVAAGVGVVARIIQRPTVRC